MQALKEQVDIPNAGASTDLPANDKTNGENGHHGEVVDELAIEYEREHQ